MKTAIVVCSFGTTVPQAMRAITAIEHAAERISPYPVYRAFTSNFIRRRILQRDGISIPDPQTVFAELTAQGFSRILCLPTHVIAGYEYEKLLSAALAFPAVQMTKPLLWSQEDYPACVQAVMQTVPPLSEQEALLLMGHGTAHPANAAYVQLEQAFHDAGYTNVYVGTVEHEPTLESILPKLHGISQVTLMPFLIVAGEHACNDLLGDQATSWKSQLEARGFTVHSLCMGLGEIPAITQHLIGHLLPFLAQQADTNDT